MIRMTEQQIAEKLNFIESFVAAENAADGSKVDSNANVVKKDIATLEAELWKQETIQMNRAIVCSKLKEMFGQETADQYIQDIKDHLIYIHDETSLKPYCVSVSMYPFLFEGTKGLGGCTEAPKNLQSFCGGFVNFVYQIASNFAGAVATVEFLMYFDYFARKQYGDYCYHTHGKEILQELQGVVYSMNQPASARGNQSVFWNISLFDEHYFESLFSDFVFPDGTKPEYGSVCMLQNAFMDWFGEESKRALLTFPVITAAMLTKEDYPADSCFANQCALWMSRGIKFFKYQSPTVDSLSSCCRLRNEMQEKDNQFSYTLGAGGVATGSKQVITLNLHRIAAFSGGIDNGTSFRVMLVAILERVYKYLVAHNGIVKNYIKKGLLPAYEAGFINESKQFLTIGINGLVEAYEGSGFMINDIYVHSVKSLLQLMKGLNKAASLQYGVKFNTEIVPAENLGVKNAKWDKEDGYSVPRDCYNSYLFPVEDQNLTVLDKIKLHGREISNCLDGGSALHLNLEQMVSYEQAKELIRLCSIHGVPYWDINVKSTVCNTCGYIDPDTKKECPKCGSTDLDYATRIIGYLKRISNFSAARRTEAAKRYYEKSEGGRKNNDVKN